MTPRSEIGGKLDQLSGMIRDVVVSARANPWLWIFVLVSSAVLATMVILMLAAAGRRRQSTPRARSSIVLPKDAIESQLESLRLEHGVRSLRRVEETLGLGELPAGVYGFTLEPERMDSPVLASWEHRLFEVHKLADGTIQVIGFITPEADRKMAVARGQLRATLFSQPESADFLPVSVPLSHVMWYSLRNSGQESALEAEIDVSFRLRPERGVITPRKAAAQKRPPADYSEQGVA